jgi:hypothetical protein
LHKDCARRLKYTVLILQDFSIDVQNWSVTLGGIWTGGVQEKVLRKIFEHKGEEVTGYWRNLHNDDLKDMLLPKVISTAAVGKFSLYSFKFR